MLLYASSFGILIVMKCHQLTRQDMVNIYDSLVRHYSRETALRIYDRFDSVARVRRTAKVDLVLEWAKNEHSTFWW